MSWMHGITITCFLASYAISLVLELARLFFQAQVRTLLALGFAAAGLVAHSFYLVGRARGELTNAVLVPLSSWHDFCLLAAWVLVGAYLGLSLRRPQNAVGIFLLPLVLGLIGLAVLWRGGGAFAAPAALNVWRLMHGLALLLGTAAVTLGFATGIMYLVQSYRLKHKLPPRQGFRLPTLEWLQRFNHEALLISTCLMAAGLLSGVILNLGERVPPVGGVEWTDPVVVSSGVLFAWLLAVTLFGTLYRPARQGKKVAYLTLASFVFLLLALGFVLFGEHATRVPVGRDAVRRGPPVLPPSLSVSVALLAGGGRGALPT
jgi:ABC-type uncharacterized transport system permease subunit